MEKSFTIRSINDYNEVIRHVSQWKSSHPIVLLQGTLGAGKTTFVKKWCSEFRVNEAEVSSPSFGLMNVYQSELGEVYHFDLYRVKEDEELEEMGFYDYLDSGKICFIEWPDNFTHLLPLDNCQWLIFEVNENEGIRTVLHRIAGDSVSQ